MYSNVEGRLEFEPSRASMVDVALLAGVSTQTVSRVANASPDVRAATRRRVTAAMNELGYRPNSAARALRRGCFRSLGVVTCSLSSPATMRTVEAIALHAAGQDFAITIVPVTAPTRAGIQDAFSRVAELAVDAVIAIVDANLPAAATVAMPLGVKVVGVDSDAASPFGAVDTDQLGGARKAVEHLLALGHETVWHVAGPEESLAAGQRATAWRAALTAAGRQAPSMSRGDWTSDSGYSIGLRLAEEPTCTAVFAANDHMALGLLKAFRERGKAVPHDISVVGFGDISGASSFPPPLTTVSQDFTNIGIRCVEEVLRQIRAKSPEPNVNLVPSQLIVRESTAVPRQDHRRP